MSSTQKNDFLFIQNPEEFKQSLISDFKKELKAVELSLKTKPAVEYLTRQDLAKMFSVDISTIHNWKVKGILKAVQIGGRVYYRSSDVQQAIVELKK